MNLRKASDARPTEGATCADRAAYHEEQAEKNAGWVDKPGGERHANVAAAHASLAVNYRLRMAAGEA